MDPNFVLADWIKYSLPVAGTIVPLAMAVVQFAGMLGAGGKLQLAISGAVGLILGAFAQIAFFGMPDTILAWFLVLIFSLMIAGGATGTYEAFKHAATKAQE